ncbi:MAG: hypothetical protein C0394_04895 [Syntrophus sp. (in: bacteria)]|nr:hypothetical protein [Syntrophus sp. (in: bacteria)]
MNKRKSRNKMQSVEKGQDIDRSFVVIPEVVPDHWRENLDRFFDENEASLDHVRHMMDISKTDVDRYYFAGGYEIHNLFPERSDASVRMKKTRPLTTRLGSFTMSYGSNGCFRYAMP